MWFNFSKDVINVNIENDGCSLSIVFVIDKKKEREIELKNIAVQPYLDLHVPVLFYHDTSHYQFSVLKLLGLWNY